MNAREVIFNTISDLVGNFLYYDRKEDEQLNIGDIEKAIKNKEISVEDIIEQFEVELTKGLNLKGL